MPIATKQQLIALRGPSPFVETYSVPGTELSVTIKGIVRSSERSAVYAEIDELAAIKTVPIDGEQIGVTEDDSVAACWSAACVRSPQLTAMEWLIVGARNTDLLHAIGLRSLVCSRLANDDELPDGYQAAALSLVENPDPLVFSPSSSVSKSSEGCLVKLMEFVIGPENGSIDGVTI
jgi:hypothetical protein